MNFRLLLWLSLWLFRWDRLRGLDGFRLNNLLQRQGKVRVLAEDDLLGKVLVDLTSPRLKRAFPSELAVQNDLNLLDTFSAVQDALVVVADL